MGVPACFFACNVWKVTGTGADADPSWLRNCVTLMSSPVRLLPRAEDATRTYDSNDTPVPQTKTNGVQDQDRVKYRRKFSSGINRPGSAAQRNAEL
jgi:hypothetical protein